MLHCGQLRRNFTEFPVNSLVWNEICRFWAEFDEFQAKLKISPVIFLVPCFGSQIFLDRREQFHRMKDLALQSGMELFLT